MSELTDPWAWLGDPFGRRDLFEAFEAVRRLFVLPIKPATMWPFPKP